MTRTKQQFEKYAENGGRDVTIWASLAQMYSSDKEIDKALATLDRAMKAFPNNRDLGTTRVSILQSSGRMNEAINGMKELYEKNPSDAQSAVNLGIMYDNNSQKLYSDAKKAADEARKGSRLTKKLADEKALLDTYMSEITRLTASIKKQPKSAELKRQLTDVQAKVAEQKGKMAEIDQQIKAEAGKGVDAAALQAKATDLSKQANETKAIARDYYQKALSTDANNFEANFNMGVGVFNDAVEMKSEVDNMSMAEYTKSGKEVEGRVCGKFKQALPYFQKAKSIKADDSTLNSTLEQLESILKQFEEKKVACVDPGK
jgi:tetratricopeptide (TPR) repeat protein